ncbi:DNA repair exonuclease [Peptoniphilus sp. oral taxon 386]|uniref:metallophosphoesterase family protein n=1 Tax=Peptoniphilus sp. oral taxon 386 TaxID=652713 RepID=UPI0001DA9B2C|nr:DNA repair exonuclease [Peptoniphilus sp. oral taxon 386]EFI42118.1 Ser/Thr phosphatase family protein [Peptoniphilus sp. oral taxon 386 str. F0131]
MRILHTADLHLGRFYRGELPKDIAILRREELWKSFENTIEYAIGNNVDVLLICGDVYERDFFTATDMLRFKKLLDKLENTETFIIAGNHDYLSDNSLFFNVNFSDKVHIFKDEDYFEVPHLNLRVYGRSWDRQFDFDTKLDWELDLNYTNLLMLHGMVDDKNYFGIDNTFIKASKFDYIALGHIHVMQKMSERCYYSGTPEPLSFKDIGKRGFIIADISGKNISVREIDNSIREYRQFEINIDMEMSVTDVENKVIELLNGSENNFNTVILKGYFSVPEYLISYLEASINYFYVKFLDELHVEYSMEELLENNRNNLMGKFILEMQSDKLALEYGVRELLAARNEN